MGRGASSRIAVGLAALLVSAAATSCSDEDAPGPAPPDAGADAGGAGGGGAAPIDAGAVLPCPAGELPDGLDGCIPPGVPADGCGTGFEHDGVDGCDPVLPAAPCEAGQLALPGETTCRPVAPCGDPPWGNIPVEANTQYVDGSYGGGDSDGTATKPWTRVQDGIDAAAAGAMVAIAAGTYLESISVPGPIELWGRCPDLVHLAPPNSPPAAIQVWPDADGAEIHALSVTGAIDGVRITDAQDVVLERVRIHDAGMMGVQLTAQAEAASATLRGSLIEYAKSRGASASGASLTIEDSVLRHTAAAPGSNGGHGIMASGGGTRPRATVTIRRSAVTSTRGMSIAASGADLLIEDSLVRDTEPYQPHQSFGHAIMVNANAADPSTLTLRRSLIERCYNTGVEVTDSDFEMVSSIVRDVEAAQADGTRGYGVLVGGYWVEQAPRPTVTIRTSVIERTHSLGLAFQGAEGLVESTIVRDTAPQPSDDEQGVGLDVLHSSYTGQRSDATVRGCRIERSHSAGVFVYGSDTAIDATLVRDTAPSRSDGSFGAGIAYLIDFETLEPALGTIERSQVDGSHAAGIVVAGGDVSLMDVVVGDTHPQQLGADFGDGIVASSQVLLLPELLPTSVDIVRATVRDSARVGVACFAASVTLGGSLLDCNTIALDGEPWEGTPFEFTDTGGNVCACGAAVTECRVLSSNLSPPPLPLP